MESQLKYHADKLYAFGIAGKSRSFREAAEVLRITQPALSRQIQTLEACLGQKLLTRSVRGIELTAAGKKLFDFSQAFLRDLSNMEERLNQKEGVMSGLLRVGTFDEFSTRLWPTLIESMKKKLPKVRITITTMNTPELHGSVQERELDLAFTRLMRERAGLEAFELFSEAFGFYCHPKWALSNLPPKMRTKIPLSNVNNIPISFVPDAASDSGETLEQLFRAKAIQFESSVEVGSFEAVKAFALKGLGLVVLPHLSAQPLVKIRKLREMTVEGFAGNRFGNHRIGIVVRRDWQSDPLINRIVGFLREQKYDDLYRRSLDGSKPDLMKSTA